MSAILNGDLRSEAKDRRRVRSHKIKWSSGGRPTVGKSCEHMPIGQQWTAACVECTKRPVHVTRPVGYADMFARGGKVHTVARKANRNEADHALDEYSDSSAAEDAWARPEADDFMYSYDAPRGPGEGSQVLGHAILQAVERYENKETEKIVREYDLVADSEEDVHFADADDDFELVNNAHL